MVLHDTRLADTILTTFREDLGRDYVPYRNHVMRCLQYCHMQEPRQDDWDKLQIAAAFHDLGIWTASTFDYIEPSVELAVGWLEKSGCSAWADDVVAAIRDHHKVLRSEVPLAEVFRKADWMDVTFGLVRHGLPGQTLRSAYRLFPDAGFHRMLMRLFVVNLRRRPLHPLPMLRW